MVATGRTDKGVHALCQYAHADLDINITEAKLKRALNSNLPNDIHVIETKIVDNNFHARYNVEKKEYEVEDTTELRNKIGYLFNIYLTALCGPIVCDELGP